MDSKVHTTAHKYITLSQYSPFLSPSFYLLLWSLPLPLILSSLLHCSHFHHSVNDTICSTSSNLRTKVHSVGFHRLQLIPCGFNCFVKVAQTGNPFERHPLPLSLSLLLFFLSLSSFVLSLSSFVLSFSLTSHDGNPTELLEYKSRFIPLQFPFTFN